MVQLVKTTQDRPSKQRGGRRADSGRPRLWFKLSDMAQFMLVRLQDWENAERAQMDMESLPTLEAYLEALTAERF